LSPFANRVGRKSSAFWKNENETRPENLALLRLADRYRHRVVRRAMVQIVAVPGDVVVSLEDRNHGAFPTEGGGFFDRARSF